MDRNRRKTTKALVALAVVTSAVAGTMTSDKAEASYFTGAMCSPGTRGQHWAVSSTPGGSVQATSGTTNLALRCAMPVNQEGGALTSTPFSFRIWRDTGSGQTYCAGDIWDHDGNAVYQTPFATISGTGQKSTYQWLNAGTGPAGIDSYNYSAQCGINTLDKLVATRLGPT
jgi:hypothetical protein